MLHNCNTMKASVAKTKQLSWARAFDLHIIVRNQLYITVFHGLYRDRSGMLQSDEPAIK